MDIHDVREALVLCGKPTRPVKILSTKYIILSSQYNDLDHSFLSFYIMIYESSQVQDFDTSSIMARLTDVSLYGGTHRRRSTSSSYSILIILNKAKVIFIIRFDAKGKGLGMSGRRDVRDLPTLWPRFLSMSSPNSNCCH